MKPDCLIIGGGVIGLSLAWELAQAGAKVRLIEKGAIGQEASWAGAGMLPPGSCHASASDLERLQFLSCKFHEQWTEKLREQTGIDNGYRPCGAIYLNSESLNTDAAAEESIEPLWNTWKEQGIEAEVLTPVTLEQIEPSLAKHWASNSLEIPSACFLPSEAQIRNPRHLKALHAACLTSGVEISPGMSAEDFQMRDGRITGVVVNGDTIHTGQVCVTSGSWSGELTRRLGISIRVTPVRGQIALLELPTCRLRRIINVGPRYLVPRGDGLILIGSTMEKVGFDRSTTVEGIRGLLDFACEILPELASAKLVKSWAGLRPGTMDGLPYLGKLPNVENGFLATGHFRAGLCLSPASAVVMRQLMQGEPPEVDLAAFRMTRAEDSTPNGFTPDEM